MSSTRRTSLISILSCGLLLGGWLAAGEAEEKPSEYQVKAACLFYFAKFIEWPSKAFADDKAPLVIAILGTDPFGDLLDSTLKDKSVEKRRVQVKRFKNLNELSDCHILFISSSEKDRLGTILEALKDRSVATVGDVGGLAEKGSVFSFFLKEESVNFEVNIEAARRAGLTISSKLLKIGVVVKDEKGGK